MLSRSVAGHSKACACGKGKGRINQGARVWKVSLVRQGRIQDLF